ncbi:hypothetical protein OG455_33800 [Kitasatospora sp. NBC_01287]|uniref:hypothetical protein n=1 Tax=Kitasatospora sp. NBC_01287 TaxID=2903573 RepID=UPI0022582D22|nr:hypothetical protein [Kitasatospora sp. NBC_01287]MCX4750428.1 hypothetical protein [Kitasatospora sp. NBC_01287]
MTSNAQSGGGVSGDGYTVLPSALDSAAKGINDAIAELKTLGFDGEATEGRGFGNMSMETWQFGHDKAHAAFSGFLDRWGWGVRTLVQDGNQISVRLGLSAGLYYQQEQYMQGVLKDAVNAGMGNPHLTDDQVEAQSWGQTWADNPINDDINHPDNAQDVAKANADIKKTWSAEGKDFVQTEKSRGGLDLLAGLI